VLIPKKAGRPIALASRCSDSRLGFDQPVVAQYRNPGIPVAAGRLFAEGLRQFPGINIALAMSDEPAPGRLIQAGGLVEKAGLPALDANALDGLLLVAKTTADDPDTLAQWTALGGRAFAREVRADDQAKEPVVISFPAPVARGVASALRTAGLRFNRSRRNGKAAPISKKPPPSQKTTAARSAASVQRPRQRPLDRARHAPSSPWSPTAEASRFPM
jgi:hypothetical protein